MNKRNIPILATAFFTLIVTLAPSPATAQINFSRTTTFGDSLTGNDLVFLVGGGLPSLYGDDPAEAVFNKGARFGDRLTNYAIPNADSSIILLQAVYYYISVALRVRQPATVISYQGGANDVVNNIELLASAPPGENREADAVIDTAAENLLLPLRWLLFFQPNTRFLIWTVPDVTLAPRYINNLSEEQAANVRAHILRINQALQALESRNNVVILDTYMLIQTRHAEPPVIFGVPLLPAPFHGEYDYQFADELHPTAVSNALLANELILTINQKWNLQIPLYTQTELARLARIPTQ